MSTIYDVAKVAGVSPKTVSRVLNGEGPVGRQTRQVVEDAISQLRYVPSSAARGLRSNRSGLVGVISGAVSDAAQEPQLSGLPELLIVQGIQDVLDASGRSLLLTDTGGKGGRAPELLRVLAEHRVEGVIYVAPFHQRVDLPPASLRQRLVLANCYDVAGTPSVIPDDYSGQRALVAGLLARGHRRIAYLQLPPELDATRHRTRAYRDALAEAGIAHDPAIVVPADVGDGAAELRVATLYDAIAKVLAAEPAPTAICCGNDRMAIAVYGMLRTRGLRIPGDISVAGYDDHRLVSETLFPTLTTVELPYRAIGRRAAELLTASDCPDAPIEVAGPVRWRDSVAAVQPAQDPTSSKGGYER
jgi:LacI family transcriptional regulator